MVAWNERRGSSIHQWYPLLWRMVGRAVFRILCNWHAFKFIATGKAIFTKKQKQIRAIWTYLYLIFLLFWFIMAYTEKQDCFCFQRYNTEVRHDGLLRAARDLIVVRGDGGNGSEWIPGSRGAIANAPVGILFVWKWWVWRRLCKHSTVAWQLLQAKHSEWQLSNDQDVFKGWLSKMSHVVWIEFKLDDNNTWCGRTYNIDSNNVFY